MVNNKYYSIGFDVLRCAAMVGVVLVHLSTYIDFGVFESYISYGAYGVSLFFVLSGYLIVQSYDNSSSGKEYLIKRFNRIIPEYWGILVFVVLFNELTIRNLPDDIFNLGWFRYVLLLQGIVPSSDSMWTNIYGFWSISCFAVFYIIYYFVGKKVRCFKHSIYFVVLAFLIRIINKRFYLLLFQHIDGVDNLMYFIGHSPLHNLYAFALGIAGYYAAKEDREILLSGILGFFSLLCILSNHEDFLMCISFVLIVMLMKNLQHFSCPILNKLFQYVSKYSFAIYLTHVFSFSMSEYVCKELLHLNNNMYLLVWGGVSAGLTIVMSLLCVNVFSKIKLRG